MKKSFKRRRPRQAAALLGFSMPKYARKAASGRFYVFCTNLTQPTGALDSKTSREVLNFLKQLNEEGNTIVMITHDNSIAMEAKRVVRIADGHKIFDGDVKDYAAIL